MPTRAQFLATILAGPAAIAAALKGQAAPAVMSVREWARTVGRGTPWPTRSIMTITNPGIIPQWLTAGREDRVTDTVKPGEVIIVPANASVDLVLDSEGEPEALLLIHATREEMDSFIGDRLAP